MSSSQAEAPSARAASVTVTQDTLSVALVDGRTIAVPLTWYPRLVHATPAERQNVRIVGQGEGIRWPDLDEDTSVKSLLEGRASQESRSSFEKWMTQRGQPRS